MRFIEQVLDTTHKQRFVFVENISLVCGVNTFNTTLKSFFDSQSIEYISVRLEFIKQKKLINRLGDVFLISDSDSLSYVSERCHKSTIYFFCHGLMSEILCPLALMEKAERVFCFSSRSEEYLTKKGLTPTLIPQLIDTDFWKFKPKWFKTGKELLLTDYREYGFYLNTIAEVVSDEGWTIRCINKPQSPEQFRGLLYKADLVVGYGRCALEAMSCGRPTFIYGANGGDGLVQPENFDLFKTTNFSGWSSRTYPDHPSLRDKKNLVVSSLRHIKNVDLKSIRDKVVESYGSIDVSLFRN